MRMVFKMVFLCLFTDEDGFQNGLFFCSQTTNVNIQQAFRAGSEFDNLMVAHEFENVSVSSTLTTVDISSSILPALALGGKS